MSEVDTMRVGDLGRMQRIATTLAKHGFMQLVDLVGIDLDSPTASTGEDTRPYARRLRNALTDLGPTFVKLGQVLSVRPDILPTDVMTEFQSLQDRVPPMDDGDVRFVLEEEIGVPMSEVFSAFDFEPVGSASIAQVHKATLLGGQKVAVKLQRRGIEPVIRSDLHILYSLAQLIESRLTVPGLHTPTEVIREFHAAITTELDFLQELQATERMGRCLAKTGVVVPRVFPRWSTRRVMVMELIVGRRLSEVAGDLDAAQKNHLAHQLMEATYQQVFEHGFFHGDPHPGNLMVTEDGSLAYIDFGITGLLTGSMQETIIDAFTSMVFRDPDTLAMTVYRAGATKGRIDLKAFKAELERKMVEYYGATLDDLSSRDTFMEVVQLATRFKIGLPAEFAVLSRAIALIEGIIRSLLPDVDIVTEVRPYATRLMSRRLAPDRLLQDVGRTVVQIQGHLRDVPTQFNQFMLDLDAGKITFVTVDPDAERLRAEMRMGVLRISLAALGATLTMGAFLFLAAWSPEPFGIPLFGVLGFVLLGSGFSVFGVLGVHVLMAQYLDWRVWRVRTLGFLRFFRWREKE